MKSILKSLAEIRSILTTQIADAYDNDDIELYDTIIDARRIIENKMDSLQEYDGGGREYVSPDEHLSAAYCDAIKK
jgi:hypothetical protein